MEQNSTFAENDEDWPESTAKIVLFLIAILLNPLVCLLGSAGNIVSLIVLSHQRMRNQTNYILAALCISDTLFLIHSLIFTGMMIHKKFDPIRGEQVRAYVYPIVGAYGSVVTARITSSLTLLLCMMRFIAVFFPMKANTICTKKNTIIAIMGVYATTLVLFVPFIFKYKAYERLSKNSTITYMNSTAFYENNKVFYEGYGTCLNIIFRFAPLLILLILNILMIHAVRQTWKQRRRMSECSYNLTTSPNQNNISQLRSMEQNHITKMLLAVSFVFLICILPGAVNSIATHIDQQYSTLGRKRNKYLCISAVTYILETINSSVNFIIYMLMSKKFRTLYKQMFCCQKHYTNITFSSVKEKLQFLNKKYHSEHNPRRLYHGDRTYRRTMSDIGPFQNGYHLSHSSNSDRAGAHSDGCFEVTLH